MINEIHLLRKFLVGRICQLVSAGLRLLLLPGCLEALLSGFHGFQLRSLRYYVIGSGIGSLVLTLKGYRHCVLAHVLAAGAVLHGVVRSRNLISLIVLCHNARLVCLLVVSVRCLGQCDGLHLFLYGRRIPARVLARFLTACALKGQLYRFAPVRRAPSN